MKSLIADDDATNQKLLYTFLSDLGECNIVDNGVAAVNAVREARKKRQSYDLVCMDLKMPGMDGHEAIHEIRRWEQKDYASKIARIIVITAHTDVDNIFAAMMGHCDAYLAKPIDITILRSKLKGLGLIRERVNAAGSVCRGVTGITDRTAVPRYSEDGFPQTRERVASQSPAEINQPIT
jgi:two-component system chemotaxis response regulator CheY